MHIQLPVQKTITLQPQELGLVDLGVQLIIPDNLYGIIKQAVPGSLALYSHTGVASSDGGVTLKLFAKNVSDNIITIPAGKNLVNISITSRRKCIWDGGSTPRPVDRPIGILYEESSILHKILQKDSPSELNLLEIQYPIHLPADDHDRYSVLQSIRQLDEIQLNNIQNKSAVPIREINPSKETVVEDFTVALMHEKIKTQNLKVISPEKLAELNKYQIDRLKKALHFDMCQKFAVLGMELLRNQATTKEIFARAQQNDEYFAVIYQSILEGIRDYPNFIIKDSVLYRRVLTNIFAP